MTDFQAHIRCPTLAELNEFAVGRNDPLREHVISCRRCAALVRRMRTETVGPSEPKDVMPFAAALPRRANGPVEGPGDVLIASSPDAPETLLVCVVLDPRTGSEPPTFEVAPVSTEVALASDFDVVLERADPLGYPALVEVWNHGTLASTQVAERLGRLPETVMAQVHAVYRALHGDTTAAVGEIPRGVAVVSDEDPRAEFQDKEAARAREFWKPSARLYQQPTKREQTVGTLMSEWLTLRDLDIPGYAVQIGWPVEEFALLCNDSFDPRALQPERIGAALAPVAASDDEFEAALRRTLRVEQFAGFGAGSGTSKGTAFARAAGSSKGRPVRRSAKQPRDAGGELERYVERALRAFRRRSRR